MNKQPSSAPSCYSEWLVWFDYLQHNNIDSSALKLLKAGSCKDASAAVGYLEEQLVRTENVMLKRYIRQFAGNLEMYLAYGEYDQIYEPFRVLGKQFEKCLFFKELEFMSQEFRQSLENSVVANAMDCWNKAVRQIYDACMESNSYVLEDQLYMIKKIRLFGDREIVKI